MSGKRPVLRARPPRGCRTLAIGEHSVVQKPVGSHSLIISLAWCRALRDEYIVLLQLGPRELEKGKERLKLMNTSHVASVEQH